MLNWGDKEAAEALAAQLQDLPPGRSQCLSGSGCQLCAAARRRPPFLVDRLDSGLASPHVRRSHMSVIDVLRGRQELAELLSSAAQAALSLRGVSGRRTRSRAGAGKEAREGERCQGWYVCMLVV